jgi:hypothetical protein
VKVTHQLQLVELSVLFLYVLRTMSFFKRCVQHSFFTVLRLILAVFGCSRHLMQVSGQHNSSMLILRIIRRAAKQQVDSLDCITAK